MLDTIFKENAPNVDWVYIQKILNTKLTKFINFWVPFIVFIIPLVIFSYGYSKSSIRVIVFFVCVVIGWLMWLMRAVVARDSIQWVKSIATVPSFVVIIAILISSYVSFGIGRVFGLDIVISPSGPLAWISAIGLILLIVQYARANIQKLHTIILSYFASSSLLVLVSVIFWIFSGGHMLLFHGSLPSQAIWFGMNFVMIIIWVVLYSRISLSKGIYGYIQKASLVLHLIILITYDYTTAWVLVIVGLVMLIITQIILQRIFFNANFAKLFILIAFCVGMIFIPANSLSDKFGWQDNFFQRVGPVITWQKYQTEILPTKGIFGVGLGEATQDFWRNAELVDIRSVGIFPLLNNGYISIIWEAGFIFIIGFVFLIISSLVYSFRLLKKFSRRIVNNKPNRTTLISLSVFIGLIYWLISFALTVPSSIMLLTFSVLVGIIASTSINSEKNSTSKEIFDPRGVRVWQFSGNRIQVTSARFIFIIVLIFFVVSVSSITKSAKAFQGFQSSITSTNDSFFLDVNKADKAITDNPQIQDFKITRIDFISKSIINTANTEPGLTFDLIIDRLRLLEQDVALADINSLTPWQAWQTGWSIHQIGSILLRLPASAGGIDENLRNPIMWLNYAEGFYNQAIATLPSNVILFTDVARFFRVVSASKDDAQKEEYLKKAVELTDKAISIDSTYTPAYIEKSEIYVLLGREEESLNFIRAFVGESESIAYRAGRIAFTSQKFEEAASFYTQVLEQNPKHLQARYDIVQSYIALTNLEKAREQFEQLRLLVPQDDVQTHELLDELGELMGG
jgi:tetratricopeptide (TPR) repeat protein